jgi:hypothetical protein
MAKADAAKPAEAPKPAPTLREQIEAAVERREKAISAAAGVDRSTPSGAAAVTERKAAKAAVEAFRSTANLVLVDEIERAVKARKA